MTAPDARTTRVLVLDTDSYRFNECAPIVGDFLDREADLAATVTGDKSLFASPALADFDAILLGGGFTRRVPRADGSGTDFVPFFTDAESEGILNAVRGGIGLVGVHTLSWMIGAKFSELLGGATSFHPPGVRELPVRLDGQEHPITQGLSDFTVPEDEVYVPGYDPGVTVLARTSWEGAFRIPVAWTHAYGSGRVFYTTLGHGPSTFQTPSVQRMLANAVRWVKRS